MANDLFLAFSAVPQLMGLEEQRASRLLELLVNPGEAKPRVRVLPGPSEATVIQFVIEEDGSLAVEALVEPQQSAVTVVNVAETGIADDRGLARELASIQFGARPVVQLGRAGESSDEIRRHYRRRLELYGMRQLPGRELRQSPPVFAGARRWKTAEARKSLKEVLDLASREPQVLERDDKEYLVIERELYDAWQQPLSPAELSQHFGRNRLAEFEFGDERTRRPGPALEFEELA